MNSMVGQPLSEELSYVPVVILSMRMKDVSKSVFLRPETDSVLKYSSMGIYSACYLTNPEMFETISLSIWMTSRPFSSETYSS